MIEPFNREGIFQSTLASHWPMRMSWYDYVLALVRPYVLEGSKKFYPHSFVVLYGFSIKLPPAPFRESQFKFRCKRDSFILHNITSRDLGGFLTNSCPEVLGTRSTILSRFVFHDAPVKRPHYFSRRKQVALGRSSSSNVYTSSLQGETWSPFFHPSFRLATQKVLIPSSCLEF
jgi:hypothetical protein